jgi:hypothetical protein
MATENLGQEILDAIIDNLAKSKVIVNGPVMWVDGGNVSALYDGAGRYVIEVAGHEFAGGPFSEVGAIVASLLADQEPF